MKHDTTAPIVDAKCSNPGEDESEWFIRITNLK
jgi:hypothetical protein